MKRILSLFLAAVLCALSAVYVFPIGSLAAPDDSSLPLKIFRKDNVESHTGILNITEVDSKLVLTAELYTKSIGFSIGFDFPDLSDKREICFTVDISGDAQSYPVTVTLSGKSASMKHTETLKEGTQTVYIKLTDAVKTDLDTITFGFTDRGALPGGITLYDASADSNFSYSYIKNFGITDASSEYTMEKAEDSMILTPKDSLCNLTPDFIKKYTKTHDLILWISLSGITQGTVYAEVNYKDTEPKILPSHAISSDSSFVFPMEGGFESVTIRFKDLSVKGTTFTVTGIGLLNMGNAGETYGAVSSFSVKGSNLTVSGSLSSDASIEYYGSKLLLYAIPYENAEDYDLADYTPIAKTDFSTNYTLKASVSKDYFEYIYIVALETSKKALPICPPIFPHTSKSLSPAGATLCSVHSSDDAAVFSLGASSVVIDVGLNELFVKEKSSPTIIYNYDTDYYLDKDCISTLDSRINFYNTAGITVYLRIFTDNTDYSFDFESNESAILAATSFLAKRYPACAGFIMGESVNQKKLSGSVSNIRKLSLFTAMFTEAVKSNNPASAVFIPLGERAEEDPYLTLAKLYYFLSLYSSAPVGILLETDNYTSMTELCAARLASIPTIFTMASEGLSLAWSAPVDMTDDAICDQYRNIFRNASLSSMRFATLCTKNIPKSRSDELFEKLKTALDEENVIPVSHSLYSASEEGGTYKGSYTLWDFQSSYDTESFVSGGDFSTPESRKGLKSDGRVLAADLLSEGTGVLVRNFERSADLSSTTACVTLCVDGREGGESTVEIIFGSRESRAAFTKTIANNTRISLYCDLSQYTSSSKIDFAAVIVNGETDSVIELSKVELFSKALSDSELSLRFNPEESESANPALYATVLLVAALTVATFSLLHKRNNHKKERE